MLKRLVEEIYAAGLTEAEIARRCGMSQPTVHRIRHGKTLDMKARTADSLRALHAELVAAGTIRGSMPCAAAR